MARLAAILILGMGVTAAGAGVSATVVPDRVFNANAAPALRNPVFGVAVQSDGKTVVSGNFTWQVNRLARFNADGTLDTAFNGAVAYALNGDAYGVVVQPDGKIVVGGDFTSPGNKLARFNVDGTQDSQFNGNAFYALNERVRSVAVQSDGKIVVGGGFTSPSTRLARFNSTGTLDSTFNGSVGYLDNDVWSVAVQSDGMIVVGGGFTVPSYRLARFNSTGRQDGLFNFNTRTWLNGSVLSVAVQSDGKIVVGGYFASPSNNLARFNADGTRDTAFNSNVGGSLNSAVESLAVQSNGKIVVAGYFTSPSASLARFNADGTPDATFNDGVGAVLGSYPGGKAVAVQPDGKIVLGGTFISPTADKVARFMPPCGPGIALTTSPTALWQQLSLPCLPAASATTVGAVLGGNTTGQLNAANFGTGWSLWKRNPANNGNVQMALADTFGLGTGHWIQSLDAPVGGKLVIDDNLSRPTPLSTDYPGGQSCVVLPVASASAGYRMMANPFPHDVDWSGVVVRVGGPGGSVYGPSGAKAAGYLSNTIWIWNGNTYATWSDNSPTKGNLQYFKSFFVHVLPGGVGQTIDLLVPARGSTLVTNSASFLTQAKTADAAQTTSPFDARTSVAAPVRPPVRPPSRPTSWVVDLGVLNTDTGWSAVAKLGQWQGAETGLDPGDLNAMPPFAQPYLTVVFPHADWQGGPGDYTTDLHPADGFAGKWDFEVRAEPLSTTAVLRWNADAAVLARSRLIDRDTGAVIYPTDPNFAGGYPMTLTTPVRRLTWEYMGN